MGNPVVQPFTSTSSLAKLNSNLRSGIGLLAGFMVMLKDQPLCLFLKMDAFSLSFSTGRVLDVDFRKSQESTNP